ncbi:MAG: DUF4864 domain-containing protein [Paracoccaceae bacterium]
MKQIFLAIAAFCLWAQLSAAQESSIEGVINSQIEAFQADDFASAFTFASPVIQRLFGNSENFGAMVRQGFPMVWRPSELQYLGLETQAGRSLQTVMIRDLAGVYHVLEYEMIETTLGWQINGVRLIGPPEIGV